jgi:hypothetical protein
VLGEVVLKGSIRNLQLRAPAPTTPFEAALTSAVTNDLATVPSYCLDIVDAELADVSLLAIPASKVRARPDRDYVLQRTAAAKIAKRSPMSDLGWLVDIAREVAVGTPDAVVIPGWRADFPKWNERLRAAADQGLLEPVRQSVTH